MTDDREARERDRVLAWERAAPVLDALRVAEIRAAGSVDLRSLMPTLDLLERLGIEVTAETGLVEQQAWFAKLRDA